jgi:hypothetical protein
MRARSECLVYPFSAALSTTFFSPFAASFPQHVPLRQAGGGGAGGTLLARRKEGPPVCAAPAGGGDGPLEVLRVPASLLRSERARTHHHGSLEVARYRGREDGRARGATTPRARFVSCRSCVDRTSHAPRTATANRSHIK